MAGFRTSEQTPFDIEMRFTMNKLLSCRFNMDTNRVEARFEDGTTLAIDCIAVEDEYGSTPAQRAELDWLLWNKPLEYAQLALGGGMEHYLSLGCDHGRMEDRGFGSRSQKIKESSLQSPLLFEPKSNIIQIGKRTSFRWCG